jgi:hypothetical protein
MNPQKFPISEGIPARSRHQGYQAAACAAFVGQGCALAVCCRNVAVRALLFRCYFAVIAAVIALLQTPRNDRFSAFSSA